MFTINLDEGTITPLVRKPPSEANIVTITLDGGTMNFDGGNKVVSLGGGDDSESRDFPAGCKHAHGIREQGKDRQTLRYLQNDKAGSAAADRTQDNIYLSLSLSLSRYVYVYIYIYICIHM